ncbi:UNVERIFIED_CONTAM: hypothetical protein Slati_1769500 [Sesamum latifolium]|uniref:Uncharacterized protein n=1 Tax=Sesamum latifolium TaxID=2727402 RepID=A0AAW2X019_9LAMI
MTRLKNQSPPAAGHATNRQQRHTSHCRYPPPCSVLMIGIFENEQQQKKSGGKFLFKIGTTFSEHSLSERTTSILGDSRDTLSICSKVELHFYGACYTHNLHIACDSEPLDMVCLLRMGIVTCNDDSFEFINAGHSTTSFVQRPESQDEDDEEDDTGEEEKDDESKEEDKEKDDESEEEEESSKGTDAHMEDANNTNMQQQATLDEIARSITRMEANLITLFEHVGLTPRRPPPP